MQAYQQRVVDEEQELYAKLKALESFTLSAHFSDVAKSEQSRLCLQVHAMRMYDEILRQRIANF